jgi:NhaP-type Na+/H+ or K+/H+ antiporter
VLLGLTRLTGGGDLAAALPRWLAVDVVWKIAGAVGVGLLFGVGLIRLNQHLPEHLRLSRSHDGIVSLGVTFIAYGLADLIDAYGFVAVFVAAVAIRNTEDKVEYTRQIYDFSAEVERLAVMVLLILFGAAIASGLFSDLRAADAVYVVVALFVVRPLAALLSFAGSRHPMPMRLATGMLGVRGVASLYYVAYAFNRADLADAAHMRSLVALVVLLSIVVFGIAAEPAMRYLERLDPQTR